MDLTHLTPGLPYSLRSLRFDPSLSLVKLYKEPLGTLKAYRDIERLKQRNYSPLFPELYLSLHPFVPLEHFCVLPKLSFASEIAIERWRIEVVESQVGDSVSPVHRRAIRGYTYLVISDLY